MGQLPENVAGGIVSLLAWCHDGNAIFLLATDRHAGVCNGFQ